MLTSRVRSCIAATGLGLEVRSFVRVVASCEAGPLCRYQGVDWRKQSNWACNQRLNPTGNFYFDGVTLSVYELVFVKVSSSIWHQLLPESSLCALKQLLPAGCKARSAKRACPGQVNAGCGDAHWQRWLPP